MLKLVGLVAFGVSAAWLVFTCLRPPAGSKIGTRARLLCLGALCVAAAWWWFAEPLEIRELRRMPLINCGNRTFEELADGFLEDAAWKYYPRHDVLTVIGTVRPDAAGIPSQPPLRARFLVSFGFFEGIGGRRNYPVSPWEPPQFGDNEGNFTTVENPDDARLLGYQRFLDKLCPKAEKSEDRQ